jgi:predicted ribosome quality control (RQC) complex YloA/Tae2 family protein
VHQQTIKAIVAELSSALTGRVLGKIFQLSSASFAIDFRRREGGYLFVSADPSLPRIYLITRRTREVEKQSIPLNEFGQALRTNLTSGKLTAVEQDESERVVRFNLLRQEEAGEIMEHSLVAQLTGRSANLFLLDAQGRITHAQRILSGRGQQLGDLYAPPPVHREETKEPPLEKGSFESLSAAADDHYLRLAAARTFDAGVATARARLSKDITRLQKLQKHLEGDLSAHGEAEQHKHIGDLLLANIGSAERHGNVVSLKDFYAEGAPPVEIEVDEKTTLQAEAGRYFARYRKAKRGAEAIAKRLAEIESKLDVLVSKQGALEQIFANRDEDALAQLIGEQNPPRKTPVGQKTQRPVEKIPGTRRYLSSDGYEVLVGRAAKDNDQLTFRIARSQDLWLHAADYPGSHVIVRNPNRKDVPHRTLVEAAQLAAKFSQANNDGKVNVNYTQQKFVSRIKGAAPGLVRLASFKTITVQPSESIERI